MVDKANFLQTLLCRFAALGRSQEHQESQEAAHSIEGNQKIDSHFQNRGKHTIGIQTEQVCPKQPDQRSAHQIGSQQHALVRSMRYHLKPRFHALE